MDVCCKKRPGHRAWREAFFNNRDEIENFSLSVSCFETRSRISSFQSHASRRDRELIPFSLMLRDEIENFCLLVSCFETRMRIWSYNLMFRDESEIFSHQSRASRREREWEAGAMQGGGWGNDKEGGGVLGDQHGYGGGQLGAGGQQPGGGLG